MVRSTTDTPQPRLEVPRTTYSVMRSLSGTQMERNGEGFQSGFSKLSYFPQISTALNCSDWLHGNLSPSIQLIKRCLSEIRRRRHATKPVASHHLNLLLSVIRPLCARCDVELGLCRSLYSQVCGLRLGISYVYYSVPPQEKVQYVIRTFSLSSSPRIRSRPSVSFKTTAFMFMKA